MLKGTATMSRAGYLGVYLVHGLSVALAAYRLIYHDRLMRYVPYDTCKVLPATRHTRNQSVKYIQRCVSDVLGARQQAP